MSAFGSDSTTDDVLDGTDISGMSVVVTGTSAGLGVETANRHFAGELDRRLRDRRVELAAESPGVMRYALDPDTASALWTRSDELLGQTFDP